MEVINGLYQSGEHLYNKNKNTKIGTLKLLKIWKTSDF